MFFKIRRGIGHSQLILQLQGLKSTVGFGNNILGKQRRIFDSRINTFTKNECNSPFLNLILASLRSIYSSLPRFSGRNGINMTRRSIPISFPFSLAKLGNTPSNRQLHQSSFLESEREKELDKESKSNLLKNNNSHNCKNW